MPPSTMISVPTVKAGSARQRLFQGLTLAADEPGEQPGGLRRTPVPGYHVVGAGRLVPALALCVSPGRLACELRHDCPPGHTQRPAPGAGLVAYVGTFSKTVFPELRIGYLVPPPSLVGALCKARQIGDWHSCALTQTALAKFMLDGDFARHLRRMHKHYAARRQVLVAHLTGELST